ncbi:M15 family metallopeptidase [Leifsonia sp. AG29]|uniref:M15 family metallopeptidase n=1 Tax=Leifsonia sp. AG29 TaxID=2598860 RepID=UPI001E29DC6B|nr:M15 family metallopeptidase [Leifsonia sp. AG29]
MISVTGLAGYRRALVRRGSCVAAALAVAVVLAGCSAASSESPSHASLPPHRAGRTALPTPESRLLGTPTPTASPTPAFDRYASSVSDPRSPWVVVNKQRPLSPLDYAPADLTYPDLPNINHQPMRAETAAALVAMFRAGKAEAGLDFSVQSAYRSFESQKRVYDADVAQHGQAYADGDTARPGHSEHQTGFAVDISAVPAACSLDACFGTTPQGRWLAANAWRFGFLLRYPADKVAVTGFTYEPWHFRYIGTSLAAELHATGVTTLEEFFGLPGGTEYR